VVLSKFVRLVSNDYLKATVQPILAHVASSKGLFELQATLLHEQLGTSINLAQVQEDNLASLLEACNFALDTITNSLNECPLYVYCSRQPLFAACVACSLARSLACLTD